MADYDIGAAFEAVEEELIASMMRNMRRHRLEEIDEGFQWSMWQAEQLKNLEQYRLRNQRHFKGKFKGINAEIDEALKKAFEVGGLEQEEKILKAIKQGFRGYRRRPNSADGFFHVNEHKLEALIQATTADMERAETAVLRMAEDQYRQIIFNSQVYANTGAATYEKAVDMATKDFLFAGLNCITYASGARHLISDYSRMAIQTASTRAYLQGEGQKRQEWGISLVIMNRRGAACPKCVPFAGKVFIDDVWSGGKASDGAYPLMSSAIAAGLYHPSCRDVHTTYFPDISEPPKPLTRAEIATSKENYELQQEQRRNERMTRKYKRMGEHSLDPVNQEHYNNKSEQWQQKNRNFIKEHSDVLREDYSRYKTRGEKPLT